MFKINLFNKNNILIKAGIRLLLLIICQHSFSAFSQRPALTMQQKVTIAMNFAGENKAELQKVLDHYGASARDSLKLRAAYFLIANMTGHFSYTGYQRQGVDSLIRYIVKAKQVAGNDFWQPGTFIQLDRLWFNVMAYASAKHSGPENTFDNKAISANLLIENIEYAFKAWSLPWSRHLSFDQFCTYVLPYRFYDEPLESWRPRYMEKFGWLAKAMGKSTDPVLACKLINESLQREIPFNRGLERYNKALSPSDLLLAGQANCLNQAAAANFAMRAMGIPVALEVVRQWANRSFGHKFSSVIDKEGNFISIIGEEFLPHQTRLPYIAPKIFHLGYTIQDDSLMKARMSSGGLVADFDCFQTDATRQLIPVKDLMVTIRPGTVKPGETVYLCVFDNRDWAPVCASASPDGKSVLFKDMGLGVLYLPMVLRDKLMPVSSPLILQNDQSIKPVIVNKGANDTITLTRKYPLSQAKLDWLWLMLDGKFEGADNPDFSGAKPLYTVQNPFAMMLNRRRIPRSNFRYVRYCFPKNAYGSLAEICFYGDSLLKQPLKGQLIHSSKVHDSDVQKAFDGVLGNYIQTPDSSDYNGEWIGLDLGEPKAITGVGFSPRNDENGIDQYMSYELYYWDDQWISLGPGTRVEDQISKLKFSKVPKGALLWLRNHTVGNEERIFLYENHAQKWW
ncbi:discoidin domain-containing protein [Mucilaginibacter paludis]|uniref:Peptide-N(4)-(N-acetyl-beta-glucosaminyl)asparagine amidase n=1 Tax=Mucilaginibacter paludis DSM 18603 TaxID=714943 RepID=H1Y3U0_9SPHI|nr:discoidin domain-containing protein [Mucilaginibacter paludis]EHQ30352.1 coagulation factor 5/8 type domain protein [Mucilaginibacter paludis DSM 18603]